MYDIHKGMNQSGFTGFEENHTNKVPKIYSEFGVKLFRDNFGRYRFIVKDVCGLLLSKDLTVEHVYTVDSMQGQGYASGLVACAKETLKKSLKFDGNFSEAGKRLFKVEDQ